MTIENKYIPVNRKRNGRTRIKVKPLSRRRRIRNRIAKTLPTIGNVLNIVSSIITIALAIYQFTK